MTQLTHYLNTHTHTRLTALFPGLPRWASTRKVKAIWILLKQETVSGSGITWAMCKSAPRFRQTTTPLCFLQAGCPSCRPTNSIKALKECILNCQWNLNCKRVLHCSTNLLITELEQAVWFLFLQRSLRPVRCICCVKQHCTNSVKWTTAKAGRITILTSAYPTRQYQYNRDSNRLERIAADVGMTVSVWFVCGYTLQLHYNHLTASFPGQPG